MAEELSNTQPTAARRPLPYSFAKRHGVLIREWRDEGAVIAHRPDADALSLMETRRFLGTPVQFEPLPAARAATQ